MNPLRALFLSLSKMPAAVMLLVIIGMAVVVTMMVTGKVSEQEQKYSDRQVQLQKKDESRFVRSDQPPKTAFYSVTYIPAGAVVEAKQIEQRKIDELEQWDDAALLSSGIVGHATKHSIPANTQLRQSDFE